MALQTSLWRFKALSFALQRRGCRRTTDRSLCWLLMKHDPELWLRGVYRPRKPEIVREFESIWKSRENRKKVGQVREGKRLMRVARVMLKRFLCSDILRRAELWLLKTPLGGERHPPINQIKWEQLLYLYPVASTTAMPIYRDWFINTLVSNL